MTSDARHEHCWNNRSKRQPGYWAQDGWTRFKGGAVQPNFVFVDDRMSQPCGQPGKGYPPLAGCVGCSELGESR